MSRGFVVRKGEDQVALRAVPAGRTTFAVDVEGERGELDARHVGGQTWSLLWNGRSFLVDLDHRKRGLVLHVGGSSVAVDFEDEDRVRFRALADREGAVGAAGEVVVAPIAGRVVKVLVESGQTVAAGEPVYVLEAMKMENEIRAERGGVVKAVHAEPGTSIETGEKLVTLE